MPSPRPGVRSRNALCVGPGCAGAFFASGTQTGAHLPQLYQKPLILLARPNRTSPPRRLILHTERLHAAVPALAGRSHRSRRVHARRLPSILAKPEAALEHIFHSPCRVRWTDMEALIPAFMSRLPVDQPADQPRLKHGLGG